jgi:hypothetical protein
VVIGVAVSLIGATVVAVVGYLTRPPKPVDLNTEIILDTSEAALRKWFPSGNRTQKRYSSLALPLHNGGGLFHGMLAA